MKTLRGRTAFVTGAASGIGRAIALALAAEGVNLILSDRNAEGLAATERDAAALGVDVMSALCDLTRPDDITAMLDRLFSDRPLHILVNCAGIALFGQQRTMREADWRALMAVNLLAPIQITTHLMDVLARSEEAHIVNIASILGLVPWRQLAAYQASKFGLVGFTLGMRNDYHRHNFGVSAVCPGLVQTPMTDLEGAQTHGRPPRLPAWVFTTPEHIARATIRAIRHDKGLVVVPALARVVWRLNRLFPGLIRLVGREGWRSRGPILPPDNGS